MDKSFLINKFVSISYGIGCDSNLVTFISIAVMYLGNLGYEPIECATEDRIRARVSELEAVHKYLIYFFKTTHPWKKILKSSTQINKLL